MSSIAVKEKNDVNVLSTVLVINDQVPDDYYKNPAYNEQLDKVIELTTDVVYPVDDEGEKSAKEFAAKIRKFVKISKDHVKAVVNQETAAVKFWEGTKKQKFDILLVNAQSPLDQFAEKKEEKLKLIRSMLIDCLAEICGDDIKPEFRDGSIEPMVKLSSLTPGGKLTASAVKYCKSIYDANLAEQQRIESRHLILENRCLKEGINPPLTQAHFGTVFYAEEALFSEKLEELIASELTRVAEMEERIRKQAEAENQRKIDDALKAQQAEIDKAKRLEEFKQEQAALREQQIDKAYVVRTSNQVDIAREEMRKAEADRKNPPVDPVTHKPVIPGKRTVTFTATFEAIVSERVSNAGVETHFLSKLPDDLKKIMRGVEFIGE